MWVALFSRCSNSKSRVRLISDDDLCTRIGGRKINSGIALHDCDDWIWNLGENNYYECIQCEVCESRERHDLKLTQNYCLMSTWVF